MTIQSFIRRFLIALAILLGSALLCLLALHKDGSISTEIWINSSPLSVWQVLTATAEYPSWNPMISRLTGDLREGNIIEFTAGPGPDGMTFRPRVLRVRVAQELAWKGKVLIPGLFDGEHRFLLEQQGNRTHLVQSELFTGLLVGKLAQGILSETAGQMHAMNKALKQRAESVSPTSSTEYSFPATNPLPK